MSQQLLRDGVEAVAGSVRRGEVSAREMVESALAAIEETDGELRAFTVVRRGRALAEADELDRLRSAGQEPGPLHGVPVAVKEELDVAGEVTSFGGRGNVVAAAADSEVVRRLRDAGAVVVGRTAMPEFGMWPFTESAAHGHTLNPWDRTRSPGGSSGGSAVAVAAGMVPVAMGGDGGGSIRIPAAACGLFGLKPQRGRVTSSPMPHLWWALGTTGPLTRRVRDSALVHDVVRGSAPGDRFGADEPAESFAEAAGREPGRLRIAWSVRSPVRGVSPAREHVQAVQDIAALLADLGHDVVEVDPAYPDVTTAFVPQFLGGVRAEAAVVEHPERLERRTREALLLGRWATPRVVERAMRHGDRLAARVDAVFAEHDLLLTPTTAHRPPRVGVLDGAGVVRAALRSLPAIAYTALWNVTGHPAASVPAGTAEDGLPLAVQLVGRTAGEPTILSVAAQLERARPWAHRWPEAATG